MRHFVTKIGAAAICTVTLAACNFGGQPTPNANQPTAVVVNQPTAVSARPTMAAQPTTASQPTAQPAPQPTAQLAPVIGFNPQAGGPGTQVDLFGNGVPANATIKVRLGFPQAMGEVLASARVGADGRWTARFTIPDRLPSGELITDPNMRLIAMNERDEALASAPFAFTPAPQDAPAPAAAATDAAGNFLNAVIVDTTGKSALPYLSDELQGAINRGEYDIHSLIGEQNPLSGFTIDSLTDNQSPNMPYPIVQATLAYGQPPQPTAIRQFSMVQQAGQWRIGAVAALDIQPNGTLDQQARDAVATLLDRLNRGAYTEAAAISNADFYILRQQNPDITEDPTNNVDVQGRLLERGCTVNGLACLQQRRIIDVQITSRDEAMVTVELNNPDGTLFTHPKSGLSAFQFRVQRLGGNIFVTGLPPYIS